MHPKSNSKTKVENIFCKVTGFNISMQKDNSISLSHVCSKYYYKIGRKVFEQIKRNYLTEDWFKSDCEIHFKKISPNL